MMLKICSRYVLCMLLGAAALTTVAAVPTPLPIGAGFDATVPPAEVQAENERWQALGLRLPPGGVVLASPYAQPYSNRSFVVPLVWYRAYRDALRANGDVPRSCR